MSAIDWPTTLPKPLVGTLQESFYPNSVSDQRQVGAARRRARQTGTKRTFSFSLRMSNTQAGYLRTFIFTTTGGGVSDFNWTHPVTLTVYEVRFANLPVDITQHTHGAWDAVISLEEI